MAVRLRRKMLTEEALASISLYRQPRSPEKMTALNGVVLVIDDEEAVRKSLKRLLRAADYETEVFDSAANYLARQPYARPSCSIVDVRMPGLTGIELRDVL